MAVKPPFPGTSQVQGAKSQIYFEFASIGGQVRVAALDSETGIEVIIIAPNSASQAQMQQIAKAKLERRLAKELEQ